MVLDLVVSQKTDLFTPTEGHNGTLFPLSIDDMYKRLQI